MIDGAVNVGMSNNADPLIGFDLLSYRFASKHRRRRRTVGIAAAAVASRRRCWEVEVVTHVETLAWRQIGFVLGVRRIWCNKTGGGGRRDGAELAL